MKVVNYILILLCLALFVTTCGVGRKLKKAEAMYETGGYDKAAKLYRKVAPKIKDKPLKAYTYFKTGEAFRKSGNAAMANRSYEQAIRNKYDDPVVFLYNAQMYLNQGSVDKTEKQLDIYQQLEPTDQRGLLIKKSIELIRDSLNTDKKNNFKIDKVAGFNSRFHDFAPAYASSDYETIYFTSSRKEGKKKKVYEVTGQTSTNIFASEKLKKGWEKPYLISDAVNTEDEEGACCFNHNFTKLYFTQCRNERDERLGCAIMSVQQQGDDWTEPENLQLVPDSMIAAHPALTSDGLTLYFTSNLPGGSGQLDIWKVTRGNADAFWSEPINLGNTINTFGNEMYPSVRKDTLFFASDGHVGYGGLDIFKAYQDKSGDWVVVNMGKPFNSYADDFGLIMEPDNERGYFSSRRKGGKGGDDIYSFMKDIPVIEFSLKGSVRDEKNKNRLAGAEVKLYGSDGSTLKRKAEKDGSFEFKLSPNTDYFATVNRQGYFAKKSNKITTKGIKESKIFTENLFMASYEAPIEIPNIFFQFGKADLSKESSTALDVLSAIMDENPNIVVELIAHTDSRGSEEVNRILSQKRAQTVVDYLVRKGVDEERMVARGMGPSAPRRVNTEIVTKHPFLRSGQILDDKFINSLTSNEEKEICYGLNRRTEIRVISDRYKP